MNSENSKTATPPPVVVSITGIRPDFIRMSEIFKKFDKKFHHIMIHTGQHYDQYLTDVFFRDLNIRAPDYILNTGKSSNNHYEQLSYLAAEVPELLKEKNIKPDLIVFLGDSNSAALSMVLKKEGYKICHIEAGMRSRDKRMLEEINRTTCDHCSDILFVYHRSYKENLRLENIVENVHVVGNTITEVFEEFQKRLAPPTATEKNSMILVDIHRPENFLYPDRLRDIIEFSYLSAAKYNIPVKILYFKRLDDSLKLYDIPLGGAIEMLMPVGYKEYLEMVSKCKFLISDSGTGQEEPALLGVPVIVPRDYTERPYSYYNNCSVRLELNKDSKLEKYQNCWDWIEKVGGAVYKMNTRWLYDDTDPRKVSDKIVYHLERFLSAA